MSDETNKDLELLEKSGTAELAVKVIKNAREQIDSLQKRVDEVDGKATEKWHETSEGKTLMESVQADLKDIRDQIKEAKDNQKEVEQAILRMQSPAGTAKSYENNKKEALRVWEKMLIKKGLEKKGHRYNLSDEELKYEFQYTEDNETKTLLTTDLDRAGALVMPDEIAREIIDQNLLEVTNIRPFVRRFTTPAMALEIPTQTAHGAANWHSEGSTRTKDTTLKVGSTTITLFGANAYYEASVEMLKFPMFPLEAFLRERYTNSLAYLHGVAYITGTGVGEPEGFMTNTSVAATNNEETSTITSGDYIKKLYFALKAPYRQNAKWGMNSLTQWTLSCLKGGDGHYLLRSMNDNDVDKVMNKQVITCESMDDVGANAYPIILADWGNFYTILDSLGAPVTITDIYTGKATGKVEYMMSMYTGGKVTNPEAGKKLYVHVT